MVVKLPFILIKVIFLALEEVVQIQETIFLNYLETDHLIYAILIQVSLILVFHFSLPHFIPLQFRKPVTQFLFMLFLMTLTFRFQFHFLLLNLLQFQFVKLVTKVKAFKELGVFEQIHLLGVSSKDLLEIQVSFRDHPCLAELV